jgi:hypothetical protein
LVNHFNGEDTNKNLRFIGYTIAAIIPLQLDAGGRKGTGTGSIAIDKDTGGIVLGGSSARGNGMSGSGEGSMFPFTGGADFIFYKYPGSIPVKGAEVVRQELSQERLKLTRTVWVEVLRAVREIPETTILLASPRSERHTKRESSKLLIAIPDFIAYQK